MRKLKKVFPLILFLLLIAGLTGMLPERLT